MRIENLSVSTITLARNKNEAVKICDSLKVLSKHFPIVVAVDGGSSPSFLKDIRNIPHVRILSEKGGLVTQVKRSLQEAARENKQFILYTESNKLAFFENSLSRFLELADSYIHDPNCGVILPCRTSDSFATFPPFQQITEGFLNLVLSKFTMSELDYTYGPRIISASLLSSLNEIGDDMGWGWMSDIILAAKKQNKKIIGIEVDLPCPIDERAETEKDKRHRIKQLRDHLLTIERNLI